MKNHKYSSLPTAEYDEDGSHSMAMIDRKLSEQNANLDILEQSVSRLGQISLSISNEITEQNRSLDALDRDIEEGQSRIDLVTQRTKDLVKKTGCGEWQIIIILSIIAVILLLLILYT